MAIVGQCMWMCPEKEREEREKYHRLSIFEIVPGTMRDKRPRANPDACVKEYSRSAAGREINPADLRPPDILLKTMNFLIDGVVGKEIGKKTSLHIYDFVADRIRGVIQDATVQRLDPDVFIEILQRASRFHIVFLHELINVEEFNKHLCLQMLNSYLSLTLSYLEISTSSLQTHRIKEFLTYKILLSIDSECVVQNVLHENRSRLKLYNNDRIFKLALANFIGDFISVFKIFAELPYMMSCCLLIHLGILRARALNTIKKAYFSRCFVFPVSVIMQWLKFDDEADTASFFDNYGGFVKKGMLTSNNKANVDVNTMGKFSNGSSYELVGKKREKEVATYINNGD